MEKEWFDWTGWDGDQECMTFYGIVTKKQMGLVPPGTKFEYGYLYFADGELTLYMIESATPIVLEISYNIRAKNGD